MKKRAKLTLTLKAWSAGERKFFGWRLYTSQHKLIAESTVIYHSTTRLRAAIWSIFGVGIGNPEDNINITVMEAPGFPKKRKKK